MRGWLLKLSAVLVLVLLLAGFLALSPPGSSGVGEEPRRLFDEIVAGLEDRCHSGAQCLNALEKDKFDVKSEREILESIAADLRKLEADVGESRSNPIDDAAFKRFGDRYHELHDRFDAWLKLVKPKVDETQRRHQKLGPLGPAV